MFSRVSWGLSPWIPHGFEAPQVDITLAKELLGWEPKVTLREGLAKTIAYFRTR